MDAQKAFTDWCVSQRVEINSIAIHRFPERGFGIVAERDFESGEEVLSVPAKTLYNTLTIDKTFHTAFDKSPSPLSVNGLLAIALRLSGVSTQWNAILPTVDEITSSIPFNWHLSLQCLLPPEATALLHAQQKKIAQDFAAISPIFPIVSLKSYTYAWFQVSTRTFYYTVPHGQGPKPKSKTTKAKAKKEPPLDHDDCISLAPFADCFNHTPNGTCTVTFSPTGYTLTTTSAVSKGDELTISYGNHSNDFLLAEYGFILSSNPNPNPWDEFPLDSLLLPLFSSAERQTLKDANFLGKYVLDHNGVCYRTQVAVRLLCMSEGKWDRLVAGGLENSEKSQGDVDAVLKKCLTPYMDVIDEFLEKVAKEKEGEESQRDTLRRRWLQIRELVTAFLEKIGGAGGEGKGK